MYHAGQILIAAAGPCLHGLVVSQLPFPSPRTLPLLRPFFMDSVTRLAVVWFPQRERTTATAIAQTSNALGTTVGFLNPLWLAPSPAAIPNVFWHAALEAEYLPISPRISPYLRLSPRSAREDTCSAVFHCVRLPRTHAVL